MSQRPRVLVIAEAANPEWVSVPLVGWSLARALSEVGDVHIVTQIRNREAFLRAGLAEGQDFTAIDSEAVAAPMFRLAQRLRMGKGVGWTTLSAISSLTYGWFERLVWRRFGPAIRAGEYDIVHRVTPLTPTANSSLAARCRRAGVPFVLGPLNGGVAWPKGFDAERRREKEWLSYVRGVYRLRPGRGAMLRAASAILCGADHVIAEIPAAQRRKCVWIPENGIDPARFNLRADQPGSLPLRGCFIGRLVPYKGADMAIEAAAPLLADGRMMLDIIGDGPQGDDLRALIDRLGLGHAVTLHGWQDHAAVQAIAAQSQMLVFPSVREFGGGVVLEAMALGLVPVVVDYGGPGELVDDRTGLKVPIGRRADIVRDLRAILMRVADDPAGLCPLAQAARARVEADFTWAAKARQIARVWQAVRAGEPLPQPLPRPK